MIPGISLAFSVSSDFIATSSPQRVGRARRAFAGVFLSGDPPEKQFTIYSLRFYLVLNLERESEFTAFFEVFIAGELLHQGFGLFVLL
jgi:hypothetical protein